MDRGKWEIWFPNGNLFPKGNLVSEGRLASPGKSASCEGLTSRDESVPPDDLLSMETGRAVTSLTYPDKDYLSGKWVQKESLSQIYVLLICLVYLSVILEITGAAILATQALSDGQKRKDGTVFLDSWNERETDCQVR